MFKKFNKVNVNPADSGENKKKSDKKKVIIVITSIIVMMAIAVGVGGYVYAMHPRVNGINIPEELSININDVSDPIAIEYSFEQEELTDEQKAQAIGELALTWSSSDESIITVDETGVVTTVGIGTAEITLKDSNSEMVDTMAVTVHNPLTGIEVTGLGEDGKITVNMFSEPVDITYNPIPEDAEFNKDAKSIALMEGAAEGIAEITEDNKVKPIGAGETTLVLTVDGKSKDLQFRVLRTPTSISAKKNVSLWAGGTHTISVSTDVENPECGTSFTFVSSNDSVASVDGNGIVTAHASGDATITVANEFGQTCEVNVNVISYPLTHSDSTSNITITKEKYAGTWCYIAHVTFTDYSRFGTSCGRGVYGGSETTSSAAARLGAILTINGDWAAPQLGYRVARSGQVCNDGSCWSEGVYSRANGILAYPGDIGIQGQNLGSLVAAGTVSDTFQFGPTFLRNGAVIGSNGGGRAQRTFIGTSGAPGDIWMVVTEGRYSDGVSAGLTYTECAQLLQSKGCTFGVPLDGGGSSTMVFKGMRLNSVSSERSVVDFVYFR